MYQYTLTLACQDRPGIVHDVTTALLMVESNILTSSQFGETASGSFFIRMTIESPASHPDDILAALDSVDRELGQQAKVRRSDELQRVVILVSKHEHCLVDLLYRWRIGELPVQIVAIVSNHPDAAPLAQRDGIRFEHVPVTQETRAEADQRLLSLVAETGAELVILARYMQILSENLCRELNGRAINIHHSFLPGFKGARPYHQAHERGVKLIGATAHYVTSDLDEGPIIEQEVMRVSHASTPEELVAMGRDVESQVLARAVKLHAEHRVFPNGSRTVVFT